MSILSEPIFKRDTKGRIRTWQYEVDGAQYRSLAGIEGGTIVPTGWTKATGKNEGRSNATTPVEQAMLEAVADEAKKLDREYRRSVAELDNVPPSPMLAKDYAALKKPLDFKTAVFSQPKLDGIRATISRHGAFSREYQRFMNVDHIMMALEPVFAAAPDVVLDGELYNHDLKEDFNTITSLVRKQAPTPAQRAEAARLVQYHIYDAPSDLTFDQRLAALGELPVDESDSVLVRVETAKVARQDELDALYARYMSEGYEGQMVRLNAPYAFDARSAALLKRKTFVSAEYPIVRVEEGLGNWAGYAKRVVVRLPNGQECGAGMRGSQSFARELLEAERRGERPAVATVRYFGETPDGSLRFPVVTDFHASGRVD